MTSGELPAVTRLRQYLRIPSVHPNIDYGPCINFLVKEGQDAGLKVTTVKLGEKTSGVLMTLPGSDPKRSSILLNSHMDVVPVSKEGWKYDPFGAEKDSNGVIYARGAQDMKSVGMQQLEAVRRIKADGIILPATIHVFFVPDEEMGGKEGTNLWVQSETFKSLKVGCVFDESVAGPYEEYPLFLEERNNYSFKISCKGQLAHGAMLFPNTAGDKLRRVIDQVMDFRQSELDKLPKENNDVYQGHVTSVNMTILSGGVQRNIVPSEFEATFDCRLSSKLQNSDFEKFIEDVCVKSGEGVSVEYLMKEEKCEATKQDKSNPYWEAFNTGMENSKAKFMTVICPGCTDAKYYRRIGIPAFGLSPINKTPMLLHMDNECISEEAFLRGIDVFYNVLLSVAKV